MKKFSTFLLLTAVGISGMQARHLTPDEALNAAFATMPQGRGATEATLAFTSTEGVDATLYVFNFGSDNGYMIVSADDCGAPVLGYTENGTFNYDDLPENAKWWLGTYSRQIKYGITKGLRYNAPIMASRAGSTYAKVVPMLKTQWGQGAPYNDQCPILDNQRAVTGCVATAFAQALKYYNYPVRGEGSLAYKYDYNDQTYSQSFNFDKVEFDWANMLDTYTGTANASQKNAVSALMLACGVCSNMSYSPIASGSYSGNTAMNLILHMGYDKAMQVLFRNTFGYYEWNDAVYKEISEGRPVVYSGANSESGHCFVCDGYDNGYFHINFGWNGVSDGYYLLSALDPDVQGTGGSTQGYNEGQEIVIGLQPAREGSEYVPNIRWSGNFTTSSTHYNIGPSSNVIVGTLNRTAYFVNQTLTAININMGLKLVDANGKVTYVEGKDDFKDVKPTQGRYNYTVATTALPVGTFTATPAFKTDGKWYDVAMPVSAINSVKMVVTSSTIDVDWSDDYLGVEVDNITTSQIYIGQPCQLTVKFKTLADVYTDVYPVLMTADGNVKGIGDIITLALPKNSEITNELVTTFKPINANTKLTAGTYLIGFLDENSQIVNSVDDKTFEVEIAEMTTVGSPQAGDVEFVGSRSKGTLKTMPATLPMYNAEIKLPVTSRGGVWIDQVCIGLLDEGFKYVESFIDPQYVVLGNMESETLTFHPNLSTMSTTTTYGMVMWGLYNAGQLTGKLYFKIDPTTGIDTINGDGNIALVYSRGASNAFVTGIEGAATIEVYAIDGRMIEAVKAEGSSASINVVRYPAGHYILKVNTADGVTTLRLAK